MNLYPGIHFVVLNRSITLYNVTTPLTLSDTARPHATTHVRVRAEKGGTGLDVEIKKVKSRYKTAHRCTNKGSRCTRPVGKLLVQTQGR